MLKTLQVLVALCGVSALMQHAYPAAPKEPLQGFHTVYEMRYSALRADVTIDLQRADRPDEYDYRVITRTRGIARLLRPGTASETAQFKYDSSGFHPLRYQFEDGTSGTESDSSIQFEWSAGLASSVHENTQVELQISPGMLDRLTADIAAINELRQGRRLTGFDLVDRNEVRHIEYTLQGEEIVKVPAGTYRALKYLRQRPGSTRATLLWFAPDAAYLPVKVVQLKRGKAVVEMLATVLEPAAATAASSPVR